MEERNIDNELFNPEEMKSPFDDIKEVDAEGHEWWNSRKLARLMGYMKYWNFERLMDKVAIEKYLCHKTDDLFRPTNRVMLFDLTNFYFEGRKENSKKAKFGRSKEKGYDCKLLVLALAINTDGFIRYSSVLEGNTADPKSLPDMVDKLIAENPAKCADDDEESE